MKLAAAHGVGVGTVQRIKAAGAAPDAKRTLRTGSLRLIGDCALAAAGLRQGP